MCFGLKPKRICKLGGKSNENIMARKMREIHNGEEDEGEGPLHWGVGSVSKSGWFCNISYFESLSSSHKNNCMPLSEPIKHSKGLCEYIHSLPFSYLCPLPK